MTNQERRDLIAKLASHQRDVLDLIDRLTEPGAEQPLKPGDRTPKGQLLHLVEAERGYLNWARRARDEDEPDLGRDTSDPERPRSAPSLYDEANVLTLEELRSRLLAVRPPTVQFLAETSDAEMERIARNTLFGDLSVHQLLKSIYRHYRMHWDEIQGFPHTYTVRTADGTLL